MRERWARLAPMLSPEDAGGVASPSVTSVAVPEPPASVPATGAEAPQAPTSAAPAPDAGKLRDLVLAANPGVIAEMVAGNTLDELLASVTPAKAAYDRVVQSVQSATPTPPAIPAGGGAARQFVVNIEELSASAKISEGLRQRKSRG